MTAIVNPFWFSLNEWPHRRRMGIKKYNKFAIKGDQQQKVHDGLFCFRRFYQPVRIIHLNRIKAAAIGGVGWATVSLQKGVIKSSFVNHQF
jgi:hypothetical protein